MRAVRSPRSRYDVKEGQSETEWLETVVFSQWPIMRHADMPTTTKTLLPRSPAPKEQSAKANSAALRPYAPSAKAHASARHPASRFISSPPSSFYTYKILSCAPNCWLVVSDGDANSDFQPLKKISPLIPQVVEEVQEEWTKIPGKITFWT